MLHQLVEVDIELFNRDNKRGELLTATQYNDIFTAILRYGKQDYLHIEVDGRQTKIYKIVEVY